MEPAGKKPKHGYNTLWAVSNYWYLLGIWKQKIKSAYIKTAEQRLLYSNTVIGTLAVDGWAVTFSTARRGLGRLRRRPVDPRCPKCNSPPINGPRPLYQLHIIRRGTTTVFVLRRVKSKERWAHSRCRCMYETKNLKSGKMLTKMLIFVAHANRINRLQVTPRQWQL